VHEFLAAGWIDRGGLRAVFVSSVDGAAWMKGRSAGLQTPGDNKVFRATRDLADVVLAGSGTVLAEGYRAIEVAPDTAARRREYGLPDVLRTAVLSATLRLAPDSGLFATDADNRTIVLTCAAAPGERRAALERVADVAVCGDDAIDLPLARAALEERGLTRISAEGGPHVYAEQAAAGVVDELCLSLTPKLVGPGPSRIVAGPYEWTGAQDLELTGLLEEDGSLFMRYRTRR
jgi:riboflavin biosynthesis pyrimidine reductase